jgi:hypothetical protein
MSKQNWSFDTRYWSLIAPQVAIELRLFPVDLKDDCLVLMTDACPADAAKKAEFEMMVRNNLGREARLIATEDFADTEFNFDELLEEFYDNDDPEHVVQVVSSPVTRNLATVVLIDSDIDRANSVRIEFEEQGYEVEHASSLAAGLRLLKSRGGLVDSVFVAPDIQGGFKRAMTKIQAKCDAQVLDISVLRQPECAGNLVAPRK